MLYCCPKLTLYLILNPVRKSRHPSVDSRLSFLPAAISPGGNTIELEPTRNSVLVDQGASRISLQEIKKIKKLITDNASVAANNQIQLQQFIKSSVKLFSCFAYLTGVYPSREIASTQHSVGDQFFAEGTLTSALRQQGHLGLHHHVSRWAICRENTHRTHNIIDLQEVAVSL